MFAVPGVQREGLPYEDGGRCHAEADTYPLVDADHVEDDEQDEESQQTSAEDEEVLSPLRIQNRPIFASQLGHLAPVNGMFLQCAVS